MIIVNVPLEKIYPNPYQTRMVDGESVKELAEDILANGLMQVPAGRLSEMHGKPVQYQQMTQEAVQESLSNGGCVELAFGHRRWTAYRMLASDPAYAGRGVDSMPVRIEQLTDIQMADQAWSENEMRRQHTPIERALAIQQRMKKFNWSQQEIADHMRISRPVISNALRLLTLPDGIQGNIQDGLLSERQAMALLSLFDLPEELRKTAEDGWNVSCKPSAVVQQAMDGESSDAIRHHVDVIIGSYARVITWPGNHEFYQPADSASIRCSDCQFFLPRNGKTHCLKTTCWEGKSAVWLKEAEPTPQPSAAHPAPSGPTDEHRKIDDAFRRPAPELPDSRYTKPTPFTPSKDIDVIDEEAQPEPEPEAPPEPNPSNPLENPLSPLTWAKSTITMTITWNAEDGSPDGRLVMIAARANQAMPIMKVYRENQVLLDGPLGDVLMGLESQFQQ